MSDDDEESLFKSKHYYDLGKAYNEIDSSVDLKETATAAAKLVGKSLFNTAVFAGKFGVGMLKQAPHTLAQHAKDQLNNNPDLTDSQREQYQEAITKSKELRHQEAKEELKKREKKERVKKEQ